MKIKDSFRKDFDRLFEMTDTLSCKKLNHTPFIVLDDVDGVCTCDSAEKLVAMYSSDTEVLKQWAGNWSSDFIRMTVGDVKNALENKK